MTLLKNSPLWKVALLGIWLGCGISLPLMRAIAPLPWNFLIWIVIFGGAVASLVIVPLMYMLEWQEQ